MAAWAGIAAIAAAIQTVVLTAAAYYAFTQAREARRVRLLNILISLRHDIDSSESRQNRYALFNELPDDLTSPLTAEQDRVVDRVVVEYENIASLVINGFIDFNLIASLYGNSTERSWKRVEPWIQKERMPRNSAPYATNLRSLPKSASNIARRSVREDSTLLSVRLSTPGINGNGRIAKQNHDKRFHQVGGKLFICPGFEPATRCLILTCTLSAWEAERCDLCTGSTCGGRSPRVTVRDRSSPGLMAR